MIALIIALGAPGYAAIRLPANSAGDKTGADIRESPRAEARHARHAPGASSATSASGAKYFCPLPVTVGRERAIEQLGLDEAAANTTNSAGEAGL